MRGVLLILTLSAVCLVEIYSKPDKVVCYYGSWATYRNGNGKFNVEDIDVTKCSHIIYSFIGINGDGSVKVLDTWNEIDLGALNRFNQLKQQNQNLKTLIAMGGWAEGSATFSKVAANEALRRNMAASVINFIQTYGFDGFDLDWEYPAQRDGAAADKANFAKLIQILREQLDATGKKYLLTAAVAATATATDLSYDVPALSKYLDFINLMAYDFHGSYDGVTGQNAPLYASSIDISAYDREKNVDASVTAWIKRGAAPEKLVLGLGVYGRSFTLSNNQNNGLGAAASNGGKAGPYTSESGMLGYNEICELQKEGGWTENWDNEQKVPFISRGDQWVGYDNVESITIKVGYAKSMNLGGLMIWSIETDDARGICGKKFPILTAINEAMDRDNNSTPEPPPSQPQTTTVSSSTSKDTPTTVSTTTTTTTQKPGSAPKCVKEGYMRDSVDCSVFYYCQKVGPAFTMSKFKCSGDLVFDLEVNVCNYRQFVQC